MLDWGEEPHMRTRPIWQYLRRLISWSRAHQLLILTLAGVAVLLVIGVIDRASAAKRRDDILFLAQVGGLIFLVVYVIATNRIAQANQVAARATEKSANTAQQTVEAALHSLQVSESM